MLHLVICGRWWPSASCLVLPNLAKCIACAHHKTWLIVEDPEGSGKKKTCCGYPRPTRDRRMGYGDGDKRLYVIAAYQRSEIGVFIRLFNLRTPSEETQQGWELRKLTAERMKIWSALSIEVMWHSILCRKCQVWNVTCERMKRPLLPQLRLKFYRSSVSCMNRRRHCALFDSQQVAIIVDQASSDWRGFSWPKLANRQRPMPHNSKERLRSVMCYRP